MTRKITKNLCSLVASLSILSSLGGCDKMEERRTRYLEEQAMQADMLEKNANREAINVYSNSLLIGNYSVPFVEITSKKTSVTLDIFQHMANEAKAQRFSLPVSEEYFSSAKIGKELSSQFNVMALFDGDIEEYSNTISKKGRSNFYVAVSSNGWRELSSDLYRRISEINQENKEYETVQKPNALILRRGGLDNSLEAPFTNSKKIVIKTYKSNITLDILKHIENGMNEMQFPLEVPTFIADKMKVGEIINKNFVGASLFFSSSPSQVSYKVIKKE